MPPNGHFQSLVSNIYPPSLLLNKENSIDSQANVLDLDISVVNGRFVTKVYDKRDASKFPVVRIVPRFSNRSESLGYSIFYTQIIRCFRICSEFDGFKDRILFLRDLFVVKGRFNDSKLCRVFNKCVLRYDINKIFPNSIDIFK